MDKAKITSLEEGYPFGDHVTNKSLGLKNVPTIIGENYVGSFCLGCKATNLPANEFYHGECGPIILVHTKVGDGADRIVAAELYKLLNDDTLVESLRERYTHKGEKHDSSV